MLAKSAIRRASYARAGQSCQTRHASSTSSSLTRPIPETKAKLVPTDGHYPKGFLAGTAHARVKPANTKYDDVTLIVSEKLCAGAAVFTRNAFKAAPIRVSKEALQQQSSSGTGVRGVVINAGCANAITGADGLEHARAMAVRANQCFDSSSSSSDLNTLVMSTGVIGQKLPIDRILDAIPKAKAVLGDSHDHWLRAAQAICTTDTFPKLVSKTFTLPSDPDTTYSIAGITKGAGMIHPNLATLLGVICTDAQVEAATLQSMLKTAVAGSFNSITIDGDTSTNDTIALFANGAAASKASSDLTGQDRDALQQVLNDVTRDLAQLVVRDGEGATKFVTIRIESTLSSEQAHRVAMSIARSPLVKTAMYGKDANWGRILCAIGYSPDALDEDSQQTGYSTKGDISLESTSVSFVPADGSAELKLLTRGEPENVDETRAKEILEMENLEIRVQLADGEGQNEAQQELNTLKVWTCDYSHEYISINSDYRS